MFYITPTPEVLNFFKINDESSKDDVILIEGDSTNDSELSVTPSTSASVRMVSQQWSRQAILLLINFYKDHQKLFLDMSIKNEKVWNLISEKLSEEGFNYTKSQVENKFKYLRARYTKKKDNMGDKQSGKSPVSFEYFEEFDEIFGKRPNITPTAAASSIQGCSFNVISEDNENAFEPEKKKTRLEKQISHLHQFFDKQNQKKEKAREKRHNEKQALMERSINVYHDMMEKLIKKL